MNGSGHCSDRSTHPLFLVARRGLHQGCHAESWIGEFKIQIYSFYMNKLLPPFITKWLFDYPEKSQFENPHPQKQLLPCICTFCHRFQIHSPFSPQIARTELPENMKNDIMILVSNLMQQEQNKKKWRCKTRREDNARFSNSNKRKYTNPWNSNVLCSERVDYARLENLHFVATVVPLNKLLWINQNIEATKVLWASNHF